MKKIRIYIILFVLLFFAGCTNYISQYKLSELAYDRTVDFTTYKTFSWVPIRMGDSLRAVEQIVYNNTVNYFANELKARNMSIDKENPDLLFELKVNETKERRAERIRDTVIAIRDNDRYRALAPDNQYYSLNPEMYYYTKPYDYEYDGYIYGFTADTLKFTNSTITLNVLDRKQNKFIYTATVEADLFENEAMQRELHPAVQTLLENYPVKVVKK